MIERLIICFILASTIVSTGCKDSMVNDKKIIEKQEFRCDYVKIISFEEPVFTETMQKGIFSVQIEGLSNRNIPKEVDIPFRGLKLLIPSEKIVEDIMINPRLKQTYKNKRIQFNKNIYKILSDNVNQNSKNIVSSKGKIYPGVYCSSPASQWKAGYQILYINLYPLQYNIKKEEVYFFKEMEVKIKYKEKDRENVPKLNKKELDNILKIIDNTEDINQIKGGF